MRGPAVSGWWGVSFPEAALYRFTSAGRRQFGHFLQKFEKGGEEAMDGSGKAVY